MKHSELAKYFGKTVIMNVNINNDEYRTVEGKVQVVEAAGLVIKTRSGPEVIDTEDVIDIEETQKPRRRRVQRRYVRVLTEDANVRQHMADRHGIMVSVLNVADDETIFTMHEKIQHDDLGHRHGERPTRAVDPAEAEKRIGQLGEYADEDEEDLEDDLEPV